ncbi:OmpA family protein [Paracoccus sp. (in: a-proteobacteria)]|uniref:OmpA family protein n=1 Tax=Paracoccus sp. TaxID=267 RepID=UPI0035AEE4C6
MANSPRSVRKPARRGPAIAASLIALAAAGGLSFLGARASADFIERNSTRDLGAALSEYDWVDLRIDGLQVFMTGTAPDEVQRFRARAKAETVVDAGRIIDDMQVAARANLSQPAFEVELLRNDDGISIIGLVPADLDRKAMTGRLSRQTGAGNVADLLETADYPIPEGWEAAFAFGLQAAELAKRAKISVAAGEVSVRAITDSPQQKVDLENALNRARPDDVTLKLDITAPRPVIAPFTLRFVKDASGARFDACAADTDAARDRILAAAKIAGLPDGAQCTLGLGAPSTRWADAAVPAIAAIGTLGAGSVTISGTDVALFAPSDVQPPAFDETVGRLEAALPQPFTLTAEHEKAGDAQTGPAEFSALVDAGGVSLRGRISDERMRDAVESLARSRFNNVDSALRIDETVPDGWTLRVIAALEALQGQSRGMVTVTPDLIKLTGVSGDQMASDHAAARLSQRLGAGAHYELAIRYDRRMDPLLGLPSGVECVDSLNAAMKESEIGFEPNKSVIAGDPATTLERLAATMKDCADFRIEVGGHTDAQGSEAFNAELSRRRAQAILEAMTQAGIDTRYTTAKGYGESMPIADNDSDAGREANRRIEFSLLADDPVVTDIPKPAELVQGVTDSAEVVADRQQSTSVAAATGAAAATLAPAPAEVAETPAETVPPQPATPDLAEAALHAATDPVAALLDAPAPHGETLPDAAQAATPDDAPQDDAAQASAAAEGEAAEGEASPEAPAEAATNSETTEPPAFVAAPDLASTAPALALMRPGASVMQAAVLPMLAAAGLARDLPAAMISGLGPSDAGDIAKALVERAVRPLPRPER